MSSIHKYQPLLAEAKSWEEIECFYGELSSKGLPMQDIIPMIQLIRADKQLSDKLYGYTSLNKLIISISNPIELWREAIHIQYNMEKELWNFKYYPLPYHEPEHERSYQGEYIN